MMTAADLHVTIPISYHYLVAVAPHPHLVVVAAHYLLMVVGFLPYVMVAIA